LSELFANEEATYSSEITAGNYTGSTNKS